MSEPDDLSEQIADAEVSSSRCTLRGMVNRWQEGLEPVGRRIKESPKATKTIETTRVASKKAGQKAADYQSSAVGAMVRISSFEKYRERTEATLTEALDVVAAQRAEIEILRERIRRLQESADGG